MVYSCVPQCFYSGLGLEGSIKRLSVRVAFPPQEAKRTSLFKPSKRILRLNKGLVLYLSVNAVSLKVSKGET